VRLVAAGLSVLLASVSPAAGQDCTGDCRGDRAVTIDEVITGVNIGLGSLPPERCVGFDRNRDLTVTIDEVVAAVNNGLGGCPPAPVETSCTIPGGTGVNFDPAEQACDLLSSYRFFRGSGSTQEPNDGVVPYDLNTPLFSDYAGKHRFVWMPAGASARYDDFASFDVPVGTVLIKTFTYPYDYGAPERGERLLETRLLVHRAGGWEGLPYIWNVEQTEARLRLVGGRLPVTWVQADGEVPSIQYVVPNANQCKECHEEQPRVLGPLGPKARSLNKDYTYPDADENQLEHWAAVGYLEGAPDPDDAPRNAVFDDPATGTLEERARAYLDVNCGSCHNPGGLARTSGLFLTIDVTDPLQLGICKIPVAAGQGSGGFDYDIEPGHPERSILIFRMESIEPGIAMPEIGRQMMHAEALDVIGDWIASLPGACR
jgi:uncharacterized repeat protein (TIGR03806 family)